MRSALVLAERGARLPLAGLPNLERLLFTAHAAGVLRFLVVTSDPEASRLRRQPAEAEISFVTPGSTEEVLGLGALGSEPAFLLLHTELAIDPRFVSNLLAAATKAGADPMVVVAGGPAPDHALATGLPLEGGERSPVGDAAPSHSVGAGIFPGEVAPSLGGGTGGAGVALRRHLATWSGQGRLGAFRAEGGHASLILSRADRRRAAWALVRGAGKDSDGVVSRWVNRRFSAAVTALLLRTPVTPNVLTSGTLVLAMLTAWALLDGSHHGFLLGTFLYQLNSALDGCDGEIARLRFQVTRFGAWADTICDQIANVSFFLAVPLGLFRRRGDPLQLWLGAFIFTGVIVALSAVYVRSRRLSGEAHFNDYGRSLARALPPGSLSARVLPALLSHVRRDAYALLFFVLALLGAEEVIAYLLAVGVAGHLVSFAMPAAPRSLEAAP